MKKQQVTKVKATAGRKITTRAKGNTLTSAEMAATGALRPLYAVLFSEMPLEDIATVVQMFHMSTDETKRLTGSDYRVSDEEYVGALMELLRRAVPQNFTHVAIPCAPK